MTERYPRGLLISTLVTGLVWSPLSAAEPPAGAAASRRVTVGAIVGVVRNSADSPIRGVTVTSAKADGTGLRATVTGSDGIYSFADVVPGEYSVSLQSDGYPETVISTLQVGAGRATRRDVVLAAGTSAETIVVSSNLNASGDKPRPAEPVATASLKLPPPSAFDKPVVDASATLFPALPSPQGPAPAAQGTVAPVTPAAPEVDLITPFADYDWTWLNGNPRNHDTAFDSKFFTPEIRADLTYTYDFNKPSDNSMGGSSELFRSNEIQLEQLGLGGDFHWDNVRARFMTQFGEYSEATIRNDGSYYKGQWNLNDADRYLAEAYGGYHINWMHGMNIDAGIFMSYVGLFSYYNYDNWAYQPSYVSSNTPWFFQGIRIQIFPTHHLKIEPWVINGWQSYASANTRKGLGGQIKWTPKPWVNIISNNYGLGHDDLYIPNRSRIHTDNSVEFKYYDRPGNGLDKMAVSITGDMGCEFGGGVSCYTDKAGGPKQSFIGYMIYNRMWFHKDMFGLTIGGGQINNPGRYLVLVPPINGETAGSAALNSPYFTFNPGDPFKAWDTSVTFDYMPKQWVTFRFEGDYRHANVPYWSGAGGVTPPPFLGGAPGTNNGVPTQYACMDGSASGSGVLVPGLCAKNGGVWYPDLRRDEVLFDIDLMVKF
jgi:Putative beta-barrel porin-2, OmpL-like. bbp2/Carboxypeptidase regulatory-like domain